MRRSRTRSIGCALAIVALAGVSCGGGGAAPSSPAAAPSARPSTPAKISILSPKNGQVFHSSTIPLKLSLKGAKIVQPTTTNISPTKGHVHVSLDGQIVSMSFNLHEPITKVAPGTHLLRVEFVASDHLPWDPRVFDNVTFEVKK